MIYKYRFLVLFVLLILGLAGIFIFPKTQASDIKETVISLSDDARSITLSSPLEKVVFVSLEATFDPSVISLSKELVPGPFFDNIIYKSTKEEANKTGRIKLTIALSPGKLKEATSGNFDLVFLDWETLSTSENLITHINFENIQIVNDEAVEIKAITIPGEYPIFITSTATATTTPSATPIVLPTTIFTPQPTTGPLIPKPVGIGLIGNYYNGTNFNQLVLRKIDSSINFNWFMGSPLDRLGGNRFSIRWRGFFFAESTGKYNFYINSDDGTRLKIDNKLIIDKWEPKTSFKELVSIMVNANIARLK